MPRAVAAPITWTRRIADGTRLFSADTRVVCMSIISFRLST